MKLYFPEVGHFIDYAHFTSHGFSRGNLFSVFLAVVLAVPGKSLRDAGCDWGDGRNLNHPGGHSVTEKELGQ